MPLSISYSSSVAQNDSQSTALGGTSGKTSSVNQSVQIQLLEGTGAGQADITLQTTVALNAGNSYEVALNLFDGTLEDEFGVVFNIKEVKAIFFEVTTTVALANCEIFADQAAPADEFKGPLNDVPGDGYTLEAGQSTNTVNSQAGGWTVDATHKQLVFKNNNVTDTNIDVMIAGVKV